MTQAAVASQGSLLSRAAVTRWLPFAGFILCMALRPLIARHAGEVVAQWFYVVQAGFAACAMTYFWREYTELRQPRLLQMRPGVLLHAVLVGALVFIAWIHLDVPWLSIDNADVMAPPSQGDAPDWRWLLVRLAGAALVVPLMEELFWRSFAMRWIDRPDFMSLAARHVSLRAVLLSSLVFGVEHHLWLAGVLAGLAYAWLYRRDGLWSAIVGHAVTNALLGAWVIHSKQWQFW